MQNQRCEEEREKLKKEKAGFVFYKTEFEEEQEKFREARGKFNIPSSSMP